MGTRKTYYGHGAHIRKHMGAHIRKTLVLSLDGV